MLDELYLAHTARHSKQSHNDLLSTIWRQRPEQLSLQKQTHNTGLPLRVLLLPRSLQCEQNVATWILLIQVFFFVDRLTVTNVQQQFMETKSQPNE